LEQIGLIISGNNEIQLPENLNPCSMANMKYAPLTSVDVEISFNLYKHILSDRRTDMQWCYGGYTRVYDVYP
jgi:hypothetical protein